MRHLTNLYNPSAQDAKSRIIRRLDETIDQAWEKQQRWLQGKVVGRPKATKMYTVEELESQNRVGIYSVS